MLLSSQTDFNYDEQTSSPNPPGPPAGEGSSESGYGKGIRSTISGAVGFIGNLTRFGGSDSHGPGRNDSERWNGNERQNNNWGTRTPSYHLSRDNLRDIAFSTLRILDEGEYFPPGQDGPYDLEAKIQWTEENTRYYGPGAGIGGKILESEFIKINEEGGDGGEEKKLEERNKDGNNTGAGEEANDASYLNETKRGENESKKATAAAASKPSDDDNANPKDQTRVRATVSQDSQEETQTNIFIGEYTTLIGARKVHLALATNSDPSANKKIGVLNFASAKKPGGGFVNGSQAQEESIARASTLFPSLITDAASEFYTHYAEDPGNAYYTHAMVYSPGIVLIRDDNGEWRSPVEVDVLTSAAVNAGEIRRELERDERLRKERVEREERLRKERVEREERLRKERVEMEYWKKRGEERRKESEKAMAERQQRPRKLEKNKKEKEEIAKPKKEQANLVKLQEEMVKKKETGKGKAKDSGSEKEEPFVGQENAVAENENEKGEEVGVEEPEENQENTADSPDSGLGSGSDSQLKDAEEYTESKTKPLPETPPPEVNQEPTSSSSILHPLSPSTQPSQASEPDPSLTYALALENAEYQIEQTMYARISRILHLFQLHQTRHLILGSFGTGVFKNRIDTIAKIFADLLIKPGGRFKDVFRTVVFAILGKETVKVFSKVFLTVDKRAKRKGTGMCVFEDKDGSDGDVKEGDEEKTMRMMRWKARRRRNALVHADPDAAAPFDPAQEDDAASHPLSFDAAQASGVSYPTSSAAADAASYPPSFDAAQADAAAYAASSHAAQASVASCPPFFDATQASEIPCPTVQTDAAVQANHTVADYYGIPEVAKMILTRDDEQVDFVAEATANAPITPSAMVVDDGKDIEMVESESLPTCSCEAQNSRSNKKEDGDIEMQ